MLKIKKEYVVTDDNKKKAVLVDIETFEKNIRNKSPAIK